MHCIITQMNLSYFLQSFKEIQVVKNIFNYFAFAKAEQVYTMRL